MFLSVLKKQYTSVKTAKAQAILLISQHPVNEALE